MNAWKDITGMVEYPRDGILSKVIFSSGEESVTLFCMSGGSAFRSAFFEWVKTGSVRLCRKPLMFGAC